MSVPEAAEYTRVSKSFLRKATRNGDLPCSDLGNRVVYDRHDLDAWVARNKRRGPRRVGDAHRPDDEISDDFPEIPFPAAYVDRDD